MILIHPCTGSSYDYFGFWVFFLTRVGRSAALVVQINRMGVIDRLSQGASAKSRLGDSVSCQTCVLARPSLGLARGFQTVRGT
jgi:hypothetical protein